MNQYYKKCFLTVFCFLLSATCISQATYIGLKDESNVRQAQSELTAFGTYWPKSQLIGDYLYIPTQHGLYRKNLATTPNDTVWELYAFENIPIRAFIKNHDTILAATALEGDSNLLLLSTDDGQTYSDYTSPHFFINHPTSTVINLVMNPQDNNEILAYHLRYGISRSTDFGLTWTSLNTFMGGYQDWFIGYNPNDTANIFYTGEQIFFRSFINASYDRGNEWQFVEQIQSHCTHGIAFHPNNKDVMISYGEGRIAKSIDQGHTWSVGSSGGPYVFHVIYEPQNPNILYATGDVNGPDENVKVLKSIDGGETWHTFDFFIPESDGALAVHLYQGQLYVFTLTNGVYTINPETLKIQDNAKLEDITIFPNPADDRLTIVSNTAISEIKIHDISGKLMSAPVVNDSRIVVDVSAFSQGFYLCSVTTDLGVVTKKILKK